MPEIDIVDATWLDVRPAQLGRALSDPAGWARWWPGLQLRVSERRGAKGVRWDVPSGCGGAARGSMEIWLQPADDGTVAHYFLRLDGTRRPLRERERRRITRRYRLHTKRALWELGDRLDPGRMARVAGPAARIP